jgi:hypothetical protein
MPFSCTLAGRCEEDVQGYESIEECQARCQSAEQRDVLAMILSYDPFNNRALLDLAHSDRMRVLRDLTGQPLQLTPDESRDDLQAIVEGDTSTLLRREPYHRYLLQHYSPQELFYPVGDVFNDDIPPLFSAINQLEPVDEEGLYDYISSLFQRQNYTMLERFINNFSVSLVIGWYPRQELLDYLLSPDYHRREGAGYDDQYIWDILNRFAQAAVNKDDLPFFIAVLDREFQIFNDQQIPGYLDYDRTGPEVADWVVANLRHVLDVRDWVKFFHTGQVRSAIIGALARNREVSRELALPVLELLKAGNANWSPDVYVEAFVGP